jgi:hypothetical protein
MRAAAIEGVRLVGGAFGDVALQRFCSECGKLAGIVASKLMPERSKLIVVPSLGVGRPGGSAQLSVEPIVRCFGVLWSGVR